MDMKSINRMQKLTEKTYKKIEGLIDDKNKTDDVKVTSDEKGMKMAIMSRSNAETINLLKKHQELFEKIDNLID